MELSDAIALITPSSGISLPQGPWADLGCGSGLFTHALANLLPAGSTIYAWDKNSVPLTPLPNPHHITIQRAQLDFQKEHLPVTSLKGIVMANALHYVADKKSLLHKLIPHLTAEGSFLIVEYDTTKANQWVPYPIPFHNLQQLMKTIEFTAAVKLGERTSLYRSGNMYAALFKR